MSELKVGTKVKDRYSLKEFKGRGSFGEVWLAYDEVLDCDVAIKIYISLDHAGIEEFKSEYLTTKNLTHINLLVPNYFDIWEHRPFLVMKYCGKGSSSSLVGKMDESSIWRFIHDVAAGLSYLHSLSEPIIHQDIKPDNILLDDSGQYLITDFGISKKVRATMRRQSRRSGGAGATAYMGPERFESYPTPVKASDIWSLGASIYELATGELPFCGLGGGMQKNGAEIPSLDRKWTNDLNMLMQSCLAKEPWDRPTADKIVEIAQNKIEGISSDRNTPDKSTPIEPKEEPAPIPPSPTPIPPGSNRNKFWMLVGSLIIVAGLGTGIYIYKNKASNGYPEQNIQTHVDSKTDDQIHSEDADEVKGELRKQNDGPNKADRPVSGKPDIYEATEQETGVKIKPISKGQSDESSTKIKVSSNDVSQGRYDFAYGTYMGQLRNGKPHGKGKITFTIAHSDNRAGYEAEPGDCLEGYFTNGSLDPGATLHKKDGTEKKLY